MTRKEYIAENEITGLAIVNACNAWKKGNISTEYFKDVVKSVTAILPHYRADEETGYLVEVCDEEWDIVREMTNVYVDAIGTDLDNFIYAPSSGCFLCFFIDEEIAYRIMNKLER